MSQAFSKNDSDSEELPLFDDYLSDFYDYVHMQAMKYRNREGMQEENFKQDVNHKFRNYLSALQIDVSIDNEFALRGVGRVDSLLDKVIIEYKSPGRLKATNTSQANIEGLNEAKKYISKLSVKENRSKSRYRAIIFDGFFVIFSRFVEDVFVSEEPIPFTRSSARVLLSTILSIKSAKPFTAERLTETFGPSSAIAKSTIEALYSCLLNPKKPKTDALYEQWKTNFSQASEFVTNSSKALALREEYRLSSSVSDPGLLLFSVHTYLALLMKITAVDVISQFSSLPSFSKSTLETSGRLFVDMLSTLERGDHFKLAGINNFLEVDYFSWYVEEMTPVLREQLQAFLLEFDKFDITTLSAEPFLTSDLIKNLYEKLIPKEIRHDLGEYYTPDWLAEFVMDEVGFDGAINKRALDPSCGSGTFLLSMIKKIKTNCYREGLNESDTLSQILNNVVGFDLNPLAVIAARTNYLIAISEFLGSIRENQSQITIPVYLCDSLLSPKKESGGLLPEIELDTSVGRLGLL